MHLKELYTLMHIFKEELGKYALSGGLKKYKISRCVWKYRSIRILKKLTLHTVLVLPLYLRIAVNVGILETDKFISEQGKAGPQNHFAAVELKEPTQSCHQDCLILTTIPHHNCFL